MRFLYKREFLKRFDSYHQAIQELIIKTDQQIKEYLMTGLAPYGLRVRKIGPKTFEARVSDRIRVVWVKEKELVSFVLLGDHDEVRRFIKQI